MLNELISQAKQIEATTDVKFAGAAMQVVKNLSVDDCEAVFVEVGLTEKAMAMKTLKHVRAGTKGYSVYRLQDDVQQIMVRSQIVR